MAAEYTCFLLPSSQQTLWQGSVTLYGSSVHLTETRVHPCFALAGLALLLPHQAAPQLWRPLSTSLHALRLQSKTHLQHHQHHLLNPQTGLRP